MSAAFVSVRFVVRKKGKQWVQQLVDVGKVHPHRCATIQKDSLQFYRRPISLEDCVQLFLKTNQIHQRLSNVLSITVPEIYPATSNVFHLCVIEVVLNIQV